MRLRFVLVSFFLNLTWIVVLASCASGMGSRKGAPAVDTSTWKTHCVGRFLISLPSDAGTRFTASFYEDKIIWERELTKESALQEARLEISKYNSIEHQELAGTQLIDSFELPNEGIVVHRWNEPYSTDLSIMECYFISNDDVQRVFTCKLSVDADHFDLGRRLMEQLATTLYARDDWDPLPTDPGFVFEGGFSKHTGKWRRESATIAFGLPSYPGIRGCFSSYGFGDKQEFMFEQEGFLDRLREVMSKIRVLRKGDCDLHGIPGQELCAAATENGRRKYTCTMDSPGGGKDLGRPQLVLELFSDNETEGNGFASDAEALAVWNAIRDSIRLRPGAI